MIITHIRNYVLYLESMRKRNFYIFFVPLLAVPIVLSSCSDSGDKTPKYLESFVVKSDNCSLVITPYCKSDVNYNDSSLLADVSIVLNHPETASTAQKIHIDNISIADSYKNPHNGYTYKTNIVTFGNYNQWSVYDKNSKQYFHVEYDIDNFSVSANIFNPYLILNSYDPSEPYEFGIYDSVDDFKYTDGYTSPTSYTSSDYYGTANINIKNSNFDVQTFSTLVSYDGFDFVTFDTIDFTNKLTTFDYFNQGNPVDIDLPPNLKTISKKAFDYVYLKYVLKIPQSVETIGDNAFSNLYYRGSSSNVTKGWIMVPNKFKKDETRISGDNSTGIEYY